MDNGTWENISCKYILKLIFSYLKVNKALNVIKLNNKMRNILDISLSHYKYYYFCSLYKTVKIETFNDILSSPYFEYFPENVRYEQALKYIEKRKLFKNEHIYLNIDAQSNLTFMKYLEENQIKKCLNFIIGNIEEKEWLQWNKWNKKMEWDEFVHKNYNDSIHEFCSKEKIDINNQILFDYNFFSSFDSIKDKNIYKNIVKYLHIYINKHPLETYNISSFENLEYLSIKIDLFKIIAYNNPNISMNIIITENQMKNIKTLKIIQSKRQYFPITDIIFETQIHQRKNFFENLEELHIKESLLNKIQFNSKKLKKLDLIYDFRDKSYSIDYFENSIVDLLDKYSNMTNFNISIYFVNDNDASSAFIQEIFNIVWPLIENIENFSLNFWDLNSRILSYRAKLRLGIKILPNRKFALIGNDLSANVYENHFDKIEQIDLSFKSRKEQCNLYLEENDSISVLKKISINQGIEDTLYIPIKSYSSLNSLEIKIEKINFVKDFPLFSKDYSVAFNNLEYVALNTETIDVITSFTNKYSCVPNLRFLSITSKIICNTVFSYHREIISKIVLLKKLLTLIIKDDESIESNLKNVEKYYTIYPELKNSNIKFSYLSKVLINK